jgi:hypothetical protein
MACTYPMQISRHPLMARKRAAIPLRNGVTGWLSFDLKGYPVILSRFRTRQESVNVK